VQQPPAPAVGQSALLVALPGHVTRPLDGAIAIDAAIDEPSTASGPIGIGRFLRSSVGIVVIVGLAQHSRK